LKGIEKVRGERPNSEREPSASKWIGPDEVQDVGDAQKW